MSGCGIINTTKSEAIQLEIGNKCCFTGYRPGKFSFDIEKTSKAKTDFENTLLEAVIDLIKIGVTEFYCGMAMGFDIIAAETVIYARSFLKRDDIKLIAAIPFAGQSASFYPAWKKRYDRILQRCDKAVLVCDRYEKGCYMKRNKFMIDSCDMVLTYWDGKPGGTKNTVSYAEKSGRKVINLYGA